jgi:NAD(P)H-flavin reductase
MKLNHGTIVEIQQASENTRTATIRLAEAAAIRPGQYVQVYPQNHHDQPVGFSLFRGGFQQVKVPETVFTTAPQIPPDWNPGDRLNLYGPLGKGFNLPQTASRVALVAVGDSSSHLLPLASAALAQNAEVALFTKGNFPQLPAKIEISPLASLADAASWTDYIALSGTWQEILQARNDLPIRNFHCPAEVLVFAPMPCSALASCGICAINDRQGNVLLVCEDGPVFDWGIV